VDLSVESLVPFLIQIIGNFLIIIHIMKASRFRRQNSLVFRRHRAREPAVLSSMTILLITCSVSFLVLTSPYSIQKIIRYSLMMWSMENYLILLTITLQLRYLNNSINFVQYIVSGRRFREELKDMCRCENQWCGGTAPSPVNSNHSDHKSRSQRSNRSNRSQNGVQIPLTRLTHYSFKSKNFQQRQSPNLWDGRRCNSDVLLNIKPEHERLP